jgi:hypothetical protein
VHAVRLVVARCEVRYTGRLQAVLPEALRLLMIKSDGSVMVQDTVTPSGNITHVACSYKQSGQQHFHETFNPNVDVVHTLDKTTFYVMNCGPPILAVCDSMLMTQFVNGRIVHRREVGNCREV